MSEPIKFELSPESVRSIVDGNIKAALLIMLALAAYGLFLWLKKGGK